MPADKGSHWFAIKTRNDFRAEEILRPLCDEVYFPTRTMTMPSGKTRVKAIIPHVLFIRTTRDKALEYERLSRQLVDIPISFWIYRYPNSTQIQPIDDESIKLVKLLTAEDSTRCEIFSPTAFKEKDHVRITGGIYEGYEGYVQRVRKNKHVVVKIEGVCLIMLPFIHPDLLEIIP